jgi:hypothetical protein
MARGPYAARRGIAIGVAAVGCALALFACSDAAVYGGGADVAGTGSAAAAAACAVPHEGCACAGNQPPIACRPEASASGVCFEGTRYCRDGVFGACEDVRAFAAPGAPAQAALLDTTAKQSPCSDCDVTCFRVRDPLEPAAGALGGGVARGVEYHESGAGLTLVARAGAIVDPPPPDDVPDGTLFLAIDPGLRGTTNYTASLHPAQSDVYLLLDQSLTMGDDTRALRDRWSDGELLDGDVDCNGADETLAQQGIAGALRCMIGTPRVGTGMFRDVPIAPYASDTSKTAAQQETEASSEIAYRHVSDQSSDLTRAKAGLDGLGAVEASGKPDVAGSAIPALYSVATGKGMFMGVGRVSVPDAAACRSGRFGYPCFREANSPVVVVVTDAPMHNGPDASRYPYNYDPAKLKRKRGTLPGQISVPATNDGWQAPYVLTDDAGNNLGTFYGSTAGMRSDVSAALAGCGASDSAKDAIFRFDVVTDAPDEEATVRINTFGSRFETVVSVLDHPPIAVENEGVDPINETFETAHDLGDVSERNVVAQSDTAGGGDYDMDPDYQGSLFAASCGADTLARDAVFALDVDGTSQPVQLEVKLDMGDARGVLAIYQDGQGPLPRWPARASARLASGNGVAASAYPIPDGDYLTIAGDSAALGADYTAAQLGGGACAPDSAGLDAVFSLHVAAARRLRFDTEGSTFDTVLSLHAAPPDAAPATFIACNDDAGADTTASALERALDPGDYYLVLKGKQAGAGGGYLLTLRDLDAVQVDEVACDAGGGSGDPARVTFVAEPGAKYYALVKGDRPSDEGPFTLSVHDLGGDAPHRLACEGATGFMGSSQLDVDLPRGSYYLVLKGEDAGDAGDYRFSIGGAAGTLERFVLPSYSQTVDALNAGRIRVGSVLSCAGGRTCDDARAQADLLAYETGGVVRSASSADDVPAQVVKTVQLMESFDTVRGELVFASGGNPGFSGVSVATLTDPNNGCASDDGQKFRSCVPGATPTFAAALTNPALSPVAPSDEDAGEYHATLRITGERDGAVVSTTDVPVWIAPGGVAPGGTYDEGSYHQDLQGERCTDVNQRPSWDRMTLDADVRPDTRVEVYACTADTAEALAACEDGGATASGYQRVATISAGAGDGTPCTVQTQARDCPNGYCSPYTAVCNEIEGASCTADEDCPGTASGRCRSGASAAALGKTCAVRDAALDPASALDGDNLRKYLRVRFDLKSEGDRSRTPSLFFWEAQYWCRNVE